MTSCYTLHDEYSDTCLLLYVETYSGIFTFSSDLCSHIVAYLEPCVTVTYSESDHIWNLGIFRTPGIFRTQSRHILAYSERCVTLACWGLSRLQNFVTFRIWKFLDPRNIQNPIYKDTFRHILAHPIMIVIIKLTLFLDFNHTYFWTKFNKTYVFWLRWRQFQCSTEST